MQVLADRVLWTGNSRDARDPKRLFDAGIGAVVDVAAEEPPAVLPRVLVYCRFPLLDGAGNLAARLNLCLQTITQLVRDREPTIVCCSAGMSRSVALAAAGYALATGSEAHSVLATYQANHPHDLMPGFWNDVLQAYSELC